MPAGAGNRLTGGADRDLSPGRPDGKAGRAFRVT